MSKIATKCQSCTWDVHTVELGLGLGQITMTPYDNLFTMQELEALPPISENILPQLACCDYHCAAVTTRGDLYTFGSKENGKLGVGRDVSSGSTGHVTQITKFLDSDEMTELADVKIGYVSVFWFNV